MVVVDTDLALGASNENRAGELMLHHLASLISPVRMLQ
jgi:hypothetical protein